MDPFEQFNATPPPRNDTMRVLSVVLASFTLLASAGIMVFVFIIAFFSNAFDRDHHEIHVGYYNGLAILSCLLAIGGAILILTKRSWGLVPYLAGQLLFLVVIWRGLNFFPDNDIDEMATFFSMLLVLCTLAGAVLQSVFVMADRR